MTRPDVCRDPHFRSDSGFSSIGLRIESSMVSARSGVEKNILSSLKISTTEYCVLLQGVTTIYCI